MFMLVLAKTCNKNGDSLVRKYAVSFLKNRKRKYAVSLAISKNMLCLSWSSWDISIFETFLLCDS